MNNTKIFFFKLKHFAYYKDMRLNVQEQIYQKWMYHG
jgi:hypothetical protein